MARDVANETADNLLAWIERTSAEVAAAILGSPLSPRVARVGRAEALAYYRAQLYTPDGAPNQAGRDALLAKVGADGFERIALAVAGVR